jgi:hypothetical protein
MSWWESLVQIRRADARKGTGVFISTTEVLTAAHVLTGAGGSVPIDDLTLDIRYQSLLAAPTALALLPAWTTSRSTGSDIALVRVEARPNLGLPTVIDHPPLSKKVMAEGAGFDANNDEETMLTGNVECRQGPRGERFLYSTDFAPVAGMSGGPICAALSTGIHVAGILIRSSSTGLIGLSITGKMLAKLRSMF